MGAEEEKAETARLVSLTHKIVIKKKLLETDDFMRDIPCSRRLLVRLRSETSSKAHLVPKEW